eukprot:6210910-Pleurochrysis_carterae.AAC.1
MHRAAPFTHTPVGHTTLALAHASQGGPSAVASARARESACLLSIPSTQRGKRAPTHPAKQARMRACIYARMHERLNA